MSFGLESGNYPSGAEFDPRAPWNEKSPPMWECRYCGEEYEDIEDKYPKYLDCNGDEVCKECLPEALDLANVEVGKLRKKLLLMRGHATDAIVALRQVVG